MGTAEEAFGDAAQFVADEPFEMINFAEIFLFFQSL